MTIKEMVYDILHRLGQVSDDATVEYRLVLNWLEASKNKAIQEWLRSNPGDYPASLFKRYTCVEIDVSGGNGYNACVELPAEVMELPMDGGVSQIIRPGGECIERVSGGISSLKLQEKQAFGDSVGERWWREGNKIYMKGKFPKNLKLDMVLAPKLSDELDQDSSFPAPDFLYIYILEEAEKIGRRKLGTFHDINNDGKDLSHASG